MMHELGPLALRQLELLITRAPPGLRFVLATRHDVRRRADVQTEQDRRVRGFDWQKQPTADPHTPIPKCVADPPGRRHHRTPPYCAPDGSST